LDHPLLTKGRTSNPGYIPVAAELSRLDAEYVREMEDVLAVYEKPYRTAEPVVCLDETPVSLHADLRTRNESRLPEEFFNSICLCETQQCYPWGEDGRRRP
jgi:hypothetical protein